MCSLKILNFFPHVLVDKEQEMPTQVKKKTTLLTNRDGLPYEKLSTDGYRVLFWNDENTLKLDSGDSYTTVNILVTTELCTLKG